jgi:hypothetical protein
VRLAGELLQEADRRAILGVYEVEDAFVEMAGYRMPEDSRILSQKNRRAAPFEV